MDLAPPGGALFDMSLVAASALTDRARARRRDLAGVAERGLADPLALTSQVIGWLLITVSLPRLPAAMTSMILTIQPIGSVVLGAVLLGEAPSGLQLSGWR